MSFSLLPCSEKVVRVSTSLSDPVTPFMQVCLSSFWHLLVPVRHTSVPLVPVPHTFSNKPSSQHSASAFGFSSSSRNDSTLCLHGSKCQHMPELVKGWEQWDYKLALATRYCLFNNPTIPSSLTHPILRTSISHPYVASFSQPTSIMFPWTNYVIPIYVAIAYQFIFFNSKDFIMKSIKVHKDVHVSRKFLNNSNLLFKSFY